MTQEEFIEQLLALPDTAAQQQFLAEHAALVDDEVADALKGQADRYLRSDVQHSSQTAALLCSLPELTGNPCHRALGLLAEANARSIGGLGEYQRAVELYDEAAEIYRACGVEVEQARSQVGKVWSLASLGRYAEAFETGAWASQVLEQHARWLPLGTLTMNLAAIHSRQGEDARALTPVGPGARHLPETGAGRRAVSADGGLSTAPSSCAISGSSMPRSKRASTPLPMLERLEQSVEAARARQNLAVTYFVLGRYNEALALLDEVRGVLIADGRRRDVILLDVFTSDCLLQLRRFADVLDKCCLARGPIPRAGCAFRGRAGHLERGRSLRGPGAFRGGARFVGRGQVDVRGGTQPSLGGKRRPGTGCSAATARASGREPDVGPALRRAAWPATSCRSPRLRPVWSLPGLRPALDVMRLRAALWIAPWPSRVTGSCPHSSTAAIIFWAWRPRPRGIVSRRRATSPPPSRSSNVCVGI